MIGKFGRGMAFVMVTLLCVAGLGGCGGDDEDATQTETTTSDDASTDAETTADETADEAADTNNE